MERVVIIASRVRAGAGRLVAVVVLALLFAEVTDNVVDHDGLTMVDRPWHRWVVEHRAPVLTPLLDAFSTIGDTAVLAVLAALVISWLAVRRQGPDAVLVAATTAGAAALVPLIKNVVARPRPPVADRLVTETNWSYPSGHTLGATADLGGEPEGLPLPGELPPARAAHDQDSGVRLAGGRPAAARDHRRLRAGRLQALPRRVHRGLPPGDRRRLCLHRG
jgi:membrane-associated phospholipid phosphatase